MKGSLEKFHDWTTVKENESFSKARVKQKVTEKKSPKQQVWTTVKENGRGSKNRFKHKVTEKTYYSCGTLKCWTCFILVVIPLMAIITVVFITMSDNLSYNQPLKSKTFFLGTENSNNQIYD
jgi:hypothetical protein